MRRLRPLLLLALLLTGCGIQPNYATDVGPPPVIDFESKLEVVYLLRDGKLEPRKVSTSSDLIEDILDALFKAGEPPPPGMKSALTGFTFVESSLTVYNPRSRNDPEVPTGLRLHVSVRGERPLKRTALAQITCTAMLDQSIWGVEITHIGPKGRRSQGEYVCSEFRDLAARGTRLPP